MRRLTIALLVVALGIPALAAPAVAVAPGGNGKIVFVSDHDRANASDLFTMDPDGSNIVRITNDTISSFGLRYEDPAWSPDGTRIAATRLDGDGCHLELMDPDGSDVVTHDEICGFNVAWSADGNTLFFADGLQPSHLWKVGVNGTGLTQLTTGDDVDDRDPAVNAAGTKLAFVRNTELVTSNLDGSSVTPLSPGTQEVLDPAWSPDGTKIAFSRTRFSYGLWMISSTGTGLVQVNPSNILTTPGWSPDGTRLVVTYESGPRELVSIKTDGSCLSSLFRPTNGGDGSVRFQPDWQPISNPTTFRIADAPGCVIAKRAVSTSTTVSIVRSGGFTGPVTLSASNLPPGTTATFSPNPATGSTSTLTLKATECPDPTPSGGYRFKVTGVNGATTRTGYYEVIIDDGLPRVLSGPTSNLVAGKTVTGSSVPVVTSWLGCDAYNPIQYLPSRWKASTWTALSTTSATSITQSLAYTTKYRYRVRVRDGGDDTSPYAYGKYLEPRLTQQTSTSVKYSSAWTSSSSSNYLGGSTRYTSTAGKSASYTFTGSSIAWVGAVGPTRGEAKVYIDGVLKATVNTNAATTAYKRTLYAFSWATQGSHTIKIVVVGTPGHARVDLDGFIRLYRT